MKKNVPYLLLWLAPLLFAGSLVWAALPQTVNPSSPADTDAVSQGATRIREGRTYLIDILGVPNNVAVTGAALSIATPGMVNFPNGICNTSTQVCTTGYVKNTGQTTPTIQATIPIADGGTGRTSLGDDAVFVGDSATEATARTLTNCTDTGGNHLNYTQSTNSFSCGTSGGASAATQAEMEAASSTTVYASPGRMRYEPRIPKVLLVWSYSGGTPSIASSTNVASISDDATGVIGVTFTTAFSDGNLLATGGAIGSGYYVSFTSPLAGSIVVRILDNSSVPALIDANGAMVIFGDQ